MKSLTDLLHILLCNKPHATDMMAILDRQKGFCHYYLEDQIDEGQTMEDHLIWIKNTEALKASLNFESDTAAMNFLKSLMKLSHEVHILSEGQPERLAFIKSILNI